jgi:hypothetical protein
MRSNRTGEVMNSLRIAILRLDGIAQISMLNLPSSAPTYPMSISYYNLSTGQPLFAEFYQKGHTTGKLIYKEVTPT